MALASKAKFSIHTTLYDVLAVWLEMSISEEPLELSSWETK